MGVVERGRAGARSVEIVDQDVVPSDVDGAAGHPVAEREGKHRDQGEPQSAKPNGAPRGDMPPGDRKRSAAAVAMGSIPT